MSADPIRPSDSLPAAYFEAKYAEKQDYWDFETSPYEAAKYADTLASLPKAFYASAFEIGCSVGVLTQKLAARCGRLLSVDVAERALAAARERCTALPQVSLQRLQFPRELPPGEELFDLIVVSEVAYYWSREELRTAQTAMLSRLSPSGQIVLVHWTSPATDYPLTGDEVHEFFHACQSLTWQHGHRTEHYRLDVFAHA